MILYCLRPHEQPVEIRYDLCALGLEELPNDQSQVIRSTLRVFLFISSFVLFRFRLLVFFLFKGGRK